MKPAQLNSIDDVLKVLDSIISRAVVENDTLGYFAALYRQVTFEVKNGIENNFFDDGPRMEKLDVVFAKRYIDAYYSWKDNRPVTQSWKAAFSYCRRNEPIVLQHLLMGMNAHINFDLGIAAAEISRGVNIELLKNDFNKINEILSMQVNGVQKNLSVIWPMLKKILSKTGKFDNFLVDFSMEIARDGAWNFGSQLWKKPDNEWQAFIANRDFIIADKSKIITVPSIWVKFLFWFVRLTEKGTTSEKIKHLTTEH
jgi:hypothetical protein